MRKSQARPGFRPVRAGVVVTTTAAAVVVGTAVPAFAADIELTPISPTSASVGAGATVTATGTGVTTGLTTVFGRLISDNNSVVCPSTYGAAPTSGPNIAVNAAKTATADSVSITVPATTPPGAYRICVYAGNATGSAIAGHTADAADFTVTTATPTAAPNTTGGTATSFTATATTPYLSLGTSAAATFISAGATCPTTYSTTGAITANATKNAANTIATIPIPTTLASGSTYTVCIFAGNTVGTSPNVAATAFSNVPSTTVSPNVGPTGGTNTVVVSSPTNFLANAHTAPGALFTLDPCPNVYTTTATGVLPSATVTKVLNNRVSVKVPTGVVVNGSDVSTAYNLCVYGDNTAGTGTLVSQALAYTVATAVTIDASSPIDQTSGPSQGGQLVTITGTGFPTAPDAQVSAAIGGTALKDVKVISSTKLQGVTQPRAAGAAAVSVTTLAGTKTTTNQPYTYDYGITVAPNTARPVATGTTGPILYVTGAGFSSIDFDAATGATGPLNAAAKGRVFLTDNAWYNGTTKGTEGVFQTGAMPTTMCDGVTVVSDTELLCTLRLGKTVTNATTIAGTSVKAGSYFVTVVNDASLTNLPTSGYSNISSGATFTVANY